MLSTKVHEKHSTELKPRRLWENHEEVKKVRISMLFFWIRSSITFWILILLIALIYLGSGVVKYEIHLILCFFLSSIGSILAYNIVGCLCG